MRVALVSPYSWSYPGGVNRHVEALSRTLSARGNEVVVMAPFDPPDRLRLIHRAEPRITSLPDNLVSLGRTVAIGANGSVSNLSTFPEGVSALRRALGSFRPDVVHVHQPMAPVVGWDACSYRGAPVVGTFHAYSTKAWPNHAASLIGARRKFNQLHTRIAVSEAARWTGRRWFGGDYQVIPNGVDLAAPVQGPKPESDEVRVLFVGRPEERKGLPVLLSAFAALAEHVPARLVLVGPTDAEGVPGVEALGRVSQEELWTQLHEADVLCAPSLSAESFGMILTEAFAAGTPVVASRIAGYSGVVTDGVDGLLVTPGEPQALGQALLELQADPARRRAMGEAARESAARYAWPRIAERIEAVYGRALEPSPPQVPALVVAASRRAGLVPIDGSPRRPARSIPPLANEPQAPAPLRRRLGLAAAIALGAALTYLAATRIGLDKVAEAVIRSDLNWVFGATALMVASMFLRAESWHAIARSAMPQATIRRRDVASATMVGVLMSATLPARLGEPARAMVLARRIGRMRATFPILLGTLVSQTLLNMAALASLGVIIIASTELFSARTERLFLVSAAPLLILLAVLLGPAIARRGGSGRLARATESIRSALVRVRHGLRVFRDLRNGVAAASTQLAAWAVQLLSCLVLFSALGLGDSPHVGIGAAAAVLFAVNVTAVVPATPSNIGVFQLAVVSVLTTGFGVSAADALAYGIVLQAVEIATAVALGLPALVREGLTWSDMRMRTVATTPVRLEPQVAPAPPGP